ncbi:MAG: 50S ribosomal protein L11 [Candidatus Peribacteraceae bacterium]|nr:50S ribosomal protein L11 [Candidatus Peribacteraceae bacterium]
MAKKIVKVVKVQARGGQANPAPPLGPVLGQAGINIQDFCTKFNEKTKSQMGQVIPAEITIYDDRSFTFILKQPPASFLILQKVGKEKGSGKPNKDKIGTIKMSQLKEIAKVKMPDLNTTDIVAATRTMAGTAKNMGLLVEDDLKVSA